LGLRENILWAKNVWKERPLPAETKLFVNLDAPDDLMIDEEERSIALTKRGRCVAGHPFNPPLWNGDPHDMSTYHPVNQSLWNLDLGDEVSRHPFDSFLWNPDP
jgi:hypothetical protein